LFSNIKHIFFDFDDTLWDFEKNSAIVLEQLFAEYELSEKLKTDFDTFHVTYKKINQELWRSYYKKEIDKQYLRNNRFDLAFREFSYTNYKENLEVTEHYLARSPYGTHLKADCIDTLNYLKEKYTLHIITNGFKEVQDIKIDACGLRDYFSCILISEEHKLTKPDLEIFRLAETLANCQKEECVMIGDNFESDIVGAEGAGWKSVFLSENPKEDFNGKIISGLGELKQLL
jgi:putative hydrolase of the HAD superfamily